jgi:hypothetical protein
VGNVGTDGTFTDFFVELGDAKNGVRPVCPQVSRSAANPAQS